MSEVFNAYILKCRQKPIISMLEEIRESLMERLQIKRDMISKMDIFLCSIIKEKLEKSKIEARGWSAFWEGTFCYGVSDGATQVKFVGDLRHKTCSCRSWQLNGIPCIHDVAAIWKNVEHPEHYVAECYHKVGYLKAYKFNMEPLNGPQEWPISEYQPINPPPLNKLRACRPKTKRRMKSGEKSSTKKLTKSGAVVRCSKCRELGHNKRNCNNNITSEIEIPSQPMHQMYTSPNDFNSSANAIQPRRVAYYTDYEGQQTLQSMTNCQGNVPDVGSSFMKRNGRMCITSQRLQVHFLEILGDTKTVKVRSNLSKMKQIWGNERKELVDCKRSFDVEILIRFFMVEEEHVGTLTKHWIYFNFVSASIYFRF
ncbi:uncharacterized protein LOC141626597 [Silene latifolia]|uniref:uncharacterized protein LOC141626597 n=1 Tax=Silene latifolia TaxID=37657 RepID=UPI003D784D01